MHGWPTIQGALCWHPVYCMHTLYNCVRESSMFITRTVVLYKYCSPIQVQLYRIHRSYSSSTARYNLWNIARRSLGHACMLDDHDDERFSQSSRFLRHLCDIWEFSTAMDNFSYAAGRKCRRIAKNHIQKETAHGGPGHPSIHACAFMATTSDWEFTSPTCITNHKPVW